MSPEPLLSLQHAFRDAILNASPGALTTALRADGAVENRLEVYRNTVQASLVAVLAAAYPIVARIVGRAVFGEVAHRFVRAQPPRVAHLSAYGRDLTAFITGDVDLSTLPYLADIARLEWARAEAYFAADAPNLDPARLGALAPNALSETVLLLHPATRMIASRYPIDRIWRVNQPEVADVPQIDMSEAESVLVSRKDFRVVLRPIAAADAILVGEIQNGGSLGAAFSRVQAVDQDFDLQRALRDHLIHGTFRE